jgi:hypothetical protein
MSKFSLARAADLGVVSKAVPRCTAPDDMARPPNQLFVATPDLKYYAYPFPRYSSVLYLVENLH